jgi:hypothetical protein
LTCAVIGARRDGKRGLFFDGERPLEAGQHILRKPHFRQRKQEGQRGFRSLISVDPIYVQPIATATRIGRVEFQAEIVPADEPVEGALSVFVPPGI